MKGELENVETYVLLDWFVADFESKFAKYSLTGDFGIIQRALDALSQGRYLLAMMKGPIEKIAKDFKLDIDQETVDSEPVKGVWTGVTFLSFGVETKEIAETYAIHFIDKILKSKMDIKIPPLKFKIFYLPPLPIATTYKGHIMPRIGGVASIRRKRIEINVYPPRDYESIFQNIVHEIFHVHLFEETSTDEVEKVESKIEAYVKTFFDKCKTEWKSEKTEIIEDLKNTLEKKLRVFKKADSALMNFRKDLSRAGYIIHAIRELYDAVLDEKVKANIPV